MRLMLDTNVCIDLLRSGMRRLDRSFRRFEIDEIGLSSISFAELKYGAAKSARPDVQNSLIIQLCASMQIAPFDDAAAECYGTIRCALERAGRSIGPLDTLIAAHAVSLDAVLVTGNLREFQRVPGLRVQRWSHAGGA